MVAPVVRPFRYRPYVLLALVTAGMIVFDVIQREAPAAAVAANTPYPAPDSVLVDRTIRPLYPPAALPR
jgi:hypothetical protein